MKWTIIEDDLPEAELILRCRDPNAPEIMRLRDYLEGVAARLPAQSEDGLLLLEPQEILYGECVGRTVFLYTQTAVFPTGLSLARLEDCAEDFFRCSKSMVVNLRHLRHLQSELSGRILATLSNQERILISRHFAAALRHRLGTI